MKIIKSEVEGVTIIGVDGEIDLNSSPELHDFFNKLVADGAQKVIIDFEKISYIDSSGLATIISAMQELKKNEGKLSLASVSEKIRNILEVTKLDKIFSIYATQEDAIASF